MFSILHVESTYNVCACYSVNIYDFSSVNIFVYLLKQFLAFNKLRAHSFFATFSVFAAGSTLLGFLLPSAFSVSLTHSHYISFLFAPISFVPTNKRKHEEVERSQYQSNAWKFVFSKINRNNTRKKYKHTHAQAFCLFSNPFPFIRFFNNIYIRFACSTSTHTVWRRQQRTTVAAAQRKGKKSRRDEKLTFNCYYMLSLFSISKVKVSFSVIYNTNI